MELVRNGIFATYETPGDELYKSTKSRPIRTIWKKEKKDGTFIGNVTVLKNGGRVDINLKIKYHLPRVCYRIKN